MKFFLAVLFWGLITNVAVAHETTKVETKIVKIEIDGEVVEMEVKEQPFDMDHDVNITNALKKLGNKIHEGLESGDHHANGLAAIGNHFVNALDIKSMGTQAIRFVNASNRSEKWREHIKNLVFLSFLTHGYEMSSSVVNYYAARSVGAGDAAAYGAAAVGIVMAIPGFVDFVCWGGYLAYGTLPPFRGLIRVLRTFTVRGGKGAASLLRLNKLQNRIMEVISSPDLSPQVRTRNMEMHGQLTSRDVQNGRRELRYTDPYYGDIRLESEVGVDSKHYIRRMTISEGIAKAWLDSEASTKKLDDITYFRERIVREFKAYGFNVRQLLKESLGKITEGETHELIHRFYVEGVGQTSQGKVVIDLIPDAVHISKARIVYPWEALKSAAKATSCRFLGSR